VGEDDPESPNEANNEDDDQDKYGEEDDDQDKYGEEDDDDEDGDFDANALLNMGAY